MRVAFTVYHLKQQGGTRKINLFGQKKISFLSGFILIAELEELESFPAVLGQRRVSH